MATWWSRAKRTKSEGRLRRQVVVNRPRSSTEIEGSTWSKKASRMVSTTEGSRLRPTRAKASRVEVKMAKVKMDLRRRHHQPDLKMKTAMIIMKECRSIRKKLKRRRLEIGKCMMI